MRKLLEEILKNLKPEYEELLINLYEDANAFTAEAVFDWGENEVCIMRDNPDSATDFPADNWKDCLKQAGLQIKEFCNQHKAELKSLKQISYGFVDGDLKYIKKRRYKLKDLPVFTEHSFDDFDAFKLDAWLCVYVKEEVKKECWEKFPYAWYEEADSKQIEEAKKFLAENFDYKEYLKSL